MCNYRYAKKSCEMNIARKGGRGNCPLLPKILFFKWTGLVSIVVKIAKQNQNLLMNGFLK